MFSRHMILGRTAAAVLAALLAILVVSGAAFAQTSNADAANNALNWMKTQQQADGSFAGLGAGSTVDAVLAIIAARQDPASFNKSGKTPIDFLQSKAADLTKTPGGAGKLLIAVAALGMDPRSFGGVDLVDAINKSYDAKTGHYGPDVIGHAFDILGLKAAGLAVPQAAVDFLVKSQNSDGGWSFSGEQGAGKADTNTTAVVLQALAAAGSQQALTIKRGITYMVSQQNNDGGYPYQKGGQYGSDSDVNSTAYGVQSMLVFQNLTMADQGLAFVRSLQLPDGAFGWMKSQPGDNASATYQAVPALLGATLVQPKGGPVPAVPPEPAGMPTTGAGQATTLTMALVVLAAMLALGGGLALRRRGAR